MKSTWLQIKKCIDILVYLGLFGHKWPGNFWSFLHKMIFRVNVRWFRYSCSFLFLTCMLLFLFPCKSQQERALTSTVVSHVTSPFFETNSEVQKFNHWLEPVMSWCVTGELVLPVHVGVHWLKYWFEKLGSKLVWNRVVTLFPFYY